MKLRSLRSLCHKSQSAFLIPRKRVSSGPVGFSGDFSFEAPSIDVRVICLSEFVLKWRPILWRPATSSALEVIFFNIAMTSRSSSLLLLID